MSAFLRKKVKSIRANLTAHPSISLIILCLALRGGRSERSHSQAHYSGMSISPSILYDPPAHLTPEPDPICEEITAYAWSLTFGMNAARSLAEDKAAEMRHGLSRDEYLVSLETLILPSEGIYAQRDITSHIKGKGKATTVLSSSDDDTEDSGDDASMNDV